MNASALAFLQNIQLSTNASADPACPSLINAKSFDSSLSTDGLPPPRRHSLDFGSDATVIDASPQSVQSFTSPQSIQAESEPSAAAADGRDLSAAYAFLNSMPRTKEENSSDVHAFDNPCRQAQALELPSRPSTSLSALSSAHASRSGNVSVPDSPASVDSPRISPRISIDRTPSLSGVGLPTHLHPQFSRNSSRRQLSAIQITPVAGCQPLSPPRQHSRRRLQRDGDDDSRIDGNETEAKSDAFSRLSSMASMLYDDGPRAGVLYAGSISNPVPYDEGRHVLLSMRDMSEARLLFAVRGDKSKCVVSAFSFFPFKAQNKLSDLREQQTLDEVTPSAKSSKWTSYEAMVSQHDSDSEPEPQYDSMLVDDPEMRWGKHRTVLNLPFFMASMIPYVRPKDLKNELNEQFSLKHPDLPANMTLSKIRKLKEMQLSCAMPSRDEFPSRRVANDGSERRAWIKSLRETELELATVSMAYIYLERLVVKRHITKQNRKTVACTCLLLAAKFNDMTKMQIRRLLEQMEDEFGVMRKAILAQEFCTYVALNFELHVEVADVLAHTMRIFQAQELTPNDYYTDTMSQTYFSGAVPTRADMVESSSFCTLADRAEDADDVTRSPADS